MRAGAMAAQMSQQFWMNCSAAMKLMRVGGTPASTAICSISRRTRFVEEPEAPEILRYAARSLAAQRFLALEQLGLDLVEAELQLPALVIERDHFAGGEFLVVVERGEQRLRLEARALIANRAHQPALGHFGIRAARLVGELQLDQFVAPAESLHGTPAAPALGARHPVAVAVLVLDRREAPHGEELAVDDAERVVGKLGPQLFSHGRLADG